MEDFQVRCLLAKHPEVVTLLNKHTAGEDNEGDKGYFPWSGKNIKKAEEIVKPYLPEEDFETQWKVFFSYLIENKYVNRHVQRTRNENLRD